MKKNKSLPPLPHMEDRPGFRTSLLAWYDECKRDLPWRARPSLYKTVISEFMLQQTRVTTVLPYFKNWQLIFPDFQSLAQAPEEKVLKAWEGLGYYSRARNLHKLAKIAATWDIVPSSLPEWQALPGVGPYIAAAVTSIALGQNHAVCDGNLVRVLTRLFSISDEYKDGASAQKKLQPLAQSIIDPDRPGDFNQAMMELGATVCHPQSPLCLTCPVLQFCQSGQGGNPESFPRIQKKKNRKKSIHRYWIEENGELLLFTDLDSKNKLSGIYELPQKLPPGFKHQSHAVESMGIRKRTIGNVDYQEEIIRIPRFESSKENLDAGYLWAGKKRIQELPLSAPHRKWIKEILEDND
jgi:A/G-specific adenine glycosylase